MDKDLLYQIALSYPQAMSTERAHLLFDYYPTAESIFKESSQTLMTISRGQFFQHEAFRTELLKKAEAECLFIEKNKIKTWYFKDENYPTRLKSCPDCPILLYTKGVHNLEDGHFISIVGTRDMTPYGQIITDKFVEELAEYKDQNTIISGLAYGVDSQAHRAALKNRLVTDAVVAHGLDMIYPASHRNLAIQMIEQGGGLITEYPSKTRVIRSNFLQRNRIVAGLSDALIVIESADKGGSLTSARLANSYNRDVFAFPGRAGDIYSKGCNSLIKLQMANLITSAEDLYKVKEWLRPKNRSLTLQFSKEENLTLEQKSILQVLQTEPLSLIQISKQTHFSLQKLNGLLLQMEIDGLLLALPGKRYQSKI